MRLAGKPVRSSTPSDGARPACPCCPRLAFWGRTPKISVWHGFDPAVPARSGPSVSPPIAVAEES